jgi:hypothetical protein
MNETEQCYQNLLVFDLKELKRAEKENKILEVIEHAFRASFSCLVLEFMSRGINFNRFSTLTEALLAIFGSVIMSVPAHLMIAATTLDNLYDSITLKHTANTNAIRAICEFTETICNFNYSKIRAVDSKC